MPPLRVRRITSVANRWRQALSATMDRLLTNTQIGIHKLMYVMCIVFMVFMGFLLFDVLFGLSGFLVVLSLSYGFLGVSGFSVLFLTVYICYFSG